TARPADAGADAPLELAKRQRLAGLPVAAASGNPLGRAGRNCSGLGQRCAFMGGVSVPSWWGSRALRAGRGGLPGAGRLSHLLVSLPALAVSRPRPAGLALGGSSG